MKIARNKNWPVVIESLFSDLEGERFFPQCVFDGGVTVDGDRQELINAVAMLNKSKLVVEKEGEGSYEIDIVLGRDPHEIVDDFTPDKELERVLSHWRRAWEEIYDREHRYPPFY